MRWILLLSCMLNGLYVSPVFASPSEYDRLFLIARDYESQRKLDAASEIYERLIQLEPGRPEAYNNLASILVSKNELASAQTLLEKAMQTDTTYATIYDNLSKLYVEMAKDSYGKALRLETGKSQLKLAALDRPVQLATSVSAEITKAQPSASKPPQKAQDQPVTMALSDNKGANKGVSKSQEIRDESALQARDKAEIITTLEGWAAAWSEQATDVYFVFYDEGYHPPGISRKSWENQRRIKLKRPDWIRVGLKNMEIKPLNNKEARVELIQEYRASNYQDTTRKEFRLRQTHDGWRIVAERSIAKIN